MRLCLIGSTDIIKDKPPSRCTMLYCGIDNFVDANCHVLKMNCSTTLSLHNLNVVQLLLQINARTIKAHAVVKWPITWKQVKIDGN